MRPRLAGVAPTAAVGAELALWRSVIAQALDDATGRAGALNGYDWRRDRGGRIRREADAWFRDAGPDFERVCALAGLEPAAVRDAALARIDAPASQEERATA